MDLDEFLETMSTLTNSKDLEILPETDYVIRTTMLRKWVAMYGTAE